jgi:hypothetical protein
MGVFICGDYERAAQQACPKGNPLTINKNALAFIR